MNKNPLVAALALVVVGGWPAAARAQQPSPPGEGSDPGPALIIKGEPTYGTVSPGHFGGPVESHPELLTPKHLEEEAKAIKEYCSTHAGECIAPETGGESAYRANRAWVSSHPSGVPDPSNTIECKTDPAHPNGPDLCYRASDHSRVYPGSPGKN
jgi:hypothetical protein